jgi:hypothetical protein
MGPGLLGDIAPQDQLQGLLGASAPTQPAAQAAPQPQGQPGGISPELAQAMIAKARPGFWGTVLGALGREGSFGQIRDQITNENLARQMLPYRVASQSRAMAYGANIPDPTEQALYFNDPTAWGEVQKTRLSDMDVAPEHVRMGPNGQIRGQGIIKAARTDNVYPANYGVPGAPGVQGAPPLPMGGPTVPGQPSAAAAGAGGSSASVQPNPANAAPADRFGSFTQNYLLPAEGGYVANDGNGAPANFGINQAANPDVNVKALTPADAAKIYHDRYWVPSGADKLPPGLGEVHADTAINMGLKPAQQLLTQSNGDVNHYLALRDQAYREMAQRNPSIAARLPGLLARNQKLGQYATGLMAAQPSPQAQSAPQAAAPAPQSNPQPGVIQTAAEPQQLTTLADRRAHGIADSDTGGYAVDADGKTFSTAPAAFTTSDAQSARKDFFGSDDYRQALNATTALNSLNRALAAAGGNNGIIDMGAVDNLVRAQTGLSARKGNVDLLMNHIGVPQEIQGKILALVGNGAITPAVIKQIQATLTAYAQAHNEMARERMANEEAFAKSRGGALGLSLPQIETAPKINWLDEAAAAAGGPAKVRTYNPKTGNLE